jgi:hypothetical protein
MAAFNFSGEFQVAPEASAAARRVNRRLADVGRTTVLACTSTLVTRPRSLASSPTGSLGQQGTPRFHHFLAASVRMAGWQITPEDPESDSRLPNHP